MTRVKEIKDQSQAAPPGKEYFEVVVNVAHAIAAVPTPRQRVLFCKMYADFLRLALANVQNVAAAEQGKPNKDVAGVFAAYKDACRVSCFDFYELGKIFRHSMINLTSGIYCKKSR